MRDIDVIKQIEKELGIELIEIDEIRWDSIGYTLNQNEQVTGLGFHKCEIQNLDQIISLLEAFPNLTALSFSLNQLRDISPLTALSNLSQLELSNNELRNISPLEVLTNLTELDLSFNRLGNISPLEVLTNLTELNLSGNDLRDISPLKALSNLMELDLTLNELSDISPLKALTNLKTLDLGFNRFSDNSALIDTLRTLPNLSQLDITRTEFGDISALIDALRTLPNLTNLDLADCQLSDISALRALPNLTVLNLINNKLNDISPLKELKHLKALYLADNKFRDISALNGLEQLVWLVLGSNQIRDISPIKELRRLRRLHLVDNHITDITSLQELKQLELLDLSNNSIEELPEWIADFDMEIQWEKGHKEGYIYLENNPLKNPPPEIVKQGKAAIKNYFNQLKAQEEDYLFEAKMLILGEPGAGKTSMAWKIENSDCSMPDEADTTRGIDVRQYYFPIQKESFAGFKRPEKLIGKEIRLNLWDFGGQEIYKATHRFFLSKRSLYALVADSRNEDTDFNYWLHIVEMFGGESPLLIVLNEKHQRKRNLDTSAMRERFENISEVIEVDFAEDDKARLDRLKTAVRYYVSQLPHIGSPVPARWTAVREALENEPRNTITLQDYMAVCRDNGIAKSQDALVLSQYFHDIGVFLHFQDDDLLNKTIFLKPNWATNAVYKILDHELLNQKSGRFDKEDAKIIWQDEEYEFIRDELLRLMQKFFLTYEISDTGEYIVPERLPHAQPAYDWQETDNLFLRYEYQHFMPRGIMSQFTVQMHHRISDHNRVWRRGVVLEREDTMAEIVETYDARTIRIRIAGKNRRDFMTVITEQIDKINAQYEKMKVDKLIPCNCGECKIKGSPFFYQYSDLRRRLEKRRREVECGISYEMVNVRALIDEVFNEALPDIGEREILARQYYRQPQKVKRDKVFVSYSRKDKEWLERVQTHLKALKTSAARSIYGMTRKSKLA